MMETLRDYIPCLFQAQDLHYIHWGHFEDNNPSSNF